MKKFLTVLICFFMCVTLFASCKEHEHISEWKYNELVHWQNVICTTNKCDFNMPAPTSHIDEDKNGICDVCGYDVSEKNAETVDSIKGIDNANKIEVVQYDIGKEVGAVTVTEETSIKHIVDNLNSLKLEKMEYNEPTAIEYELAFYNADGEMMKTVSITLGGWVDYHGSLHSVVGGELDIAYIEGLFK